MSYFPAVVAPLALLAAAALPQEPTLADLDERLADVKKLCDRGKWKDAKEELLAAAADHAETPGVLTRVGGMRDRLRAASFWLQYERPKPGDVLKGRVKKYSASDGKIELRYEWEKGQKMSDEPMDFFSVPADRETWLHPAPFAGKYSLEVKGVGVGSTPGLYACLTDFDNFYTAAFDNGDVSGLHQCKDGEFEMIMLAGASFHSERRYEFAIQVDKRRLRATVKGKPLLETKRDPKDPWGYCGFVNFKGIREITVKGIVDPGWVEGLIDEKVQVDMAAFQASYDATKDLPTGLQEALAARRERAEDLEDVYPGEREPQLSQSAERIWKYLNDGKVDEAYDHLAALDEKATEAYRKWMSLWITWVDGDPEAALQHCEWVVENAPEFYWGHHVRALFRSSRISRAEELEDARGLVEHFPSRSEAHDRLALVLMRDRKLDEAQGVLEKAIEGGCSPDALELRRVTLLRAQQGPLWNRPHEWKTRHFIVRSDMGEDRCSEAAQLLEKAHARWNSHLRRVPKKKGAKRAPVFLFAGEAGYHAYTKELIEEEAEHTLGVYVPSVGQLMIWSGRDREEWAHTVRHEGFHQYLDKLAPTAPVWFHEGMAEYYASDEKLRGRWIAGYIYPHYLSALRREELVPLDRFLRLDSKAFMKDAALHYAQAWAFIHFLLHGKDHKNKKRFNDYLDALIEGAGAEDALTAAFGEAPLKDLDQKLATHIERMKVR